MTNSGQSCDAPTRMLVENTIYERSIKEAKEEANNIKVDLSHKKGDHIGPVVSKKQYDKILDLISRYTNTKLIFLVFFNVFFPRFS